jgi:hypothetical protein
VIGFPQIPLTGVSEMQKSQSAVTLPGEAWAEVIKSALTQPCATWVLGSVESATTEVASETRIRSAERRRGGVNFMVSQTVPPSKTMIAELSEDAKYFLGIFRAGVLNLR